MAREMLAAGDNFRKLIEGPNKLKHELGYDPSFLTMDGRPYNLDYLKKTEGRFTVGGVNFCRHQRENCRIQFQHPKLLPKSPKTEEHRHCG